ncbi:MAG: hypothetical protein OEV00_07580 [Acidobacteriota bacterium]|nr:hypothetical protein [Acidobacteriota bacterium]MDH3785174.1 hypothetical protein [Acidobacteriota bacterium]
MNPRIRFVLSLLAWVVLGCQPTFSQTDRPAGNVLGQATIKEAYDAYHTERLTDGVLGPEGGHWLSDRNTLFTSMGYVVFELPQTIPVGYARNERIRATRSVTVVESAPWPRRITRAI